MKTKNLICIFIIFISLFIYSGQGNAQVSEQDFLIRKAVLLKSSPAIWTLIHSGVLCSLGRYLHLEKIS
jgi:hypothetical protein